jgi:choline dehydrogenase-like flavoprotein
VLAWFSERIDALSISETGKMTDVMDYVVVGGGSAGCAVTGRLAENPSISVAMLEAGGSDDSWIVNFPAAVFLMVGSPINNWHIPDRG